MKLNVLKPFDYLFYRNYIFFQKKKDMPFFSSVLSMSVLYMALTSALWYNLGYLIFTEDIVVFRYIGRKYTLTLIIFALLYFIATFFLYKKRKEKILMEFVKSKYNKLIPYWVIPCCSFLSFFAGLIPGIILNDFLEEHNMEGIISRWFFS